MEHPMKFYHHRRISRSPFAVSKSWRKRTLAVEIMQGRDKIRRPFRFSEYLGDQRDRFDLNCGMTEIDR
jgi:hypothetical protein